MYGKMKAVVVVVVLLVLGLGVATVQASSDSIGPINLLNPWNPTTQTVGRAIDRSLISGARLPHAAPLDGFSSWSMFTDYSSSNSNDKRAGGFDSYSNSYLIGADAQYNGTLWGFMSNLYEAKGHNGAAGGDRVDSQTYSLYMSRNINDWMAWGASFSYGKADSKTRGIAGTTESDSYVLAPYLTMMTRINEIALSLSPAYVLAYQEVDSPQAAVSTDTALMGKLVLMGRASYALSDRLNIAGNLNFNQVLHNHGLDTENDPDHQWFTTGISLGYQLTSNLNCKIGYDTDFDSDFNSEILNVGLSYIF